MGTIGTHMKYWLPQNSIMKLTQYPIIESQVHSNILRILQQDIGAWICNLLSTICNPHELVSMI